MSESFPAESRRTVQDDTREEQLARLLGLQRSRGRIGSDARDEHDNRFELKTTTTGSVTTARDVGPEYLDRLRQSYLIAARGKNTSFGFQVGEVYFLSPAMLDEWLAGIEGRLAADRQLVDDAINTLASGRFEGDLERLRYLGYRGLTINNPKIPWAYVSSHGVAIESDPALHLRELVGRFPIAPAP